MKKLSIFLFVLCTFLTMGAKAQVSDEKYPGKISPQIIFPNEDKPAKLSAFIGDKNKPIIISKKIIY